MSTYFESFSTTSMFDWLWNRLFADLRVIQNIIEAAVFNLDQNNKKIIVSRLGY